MDAVVHYESISDSELSIENPLIEPIYCQCESVKNESRFAKYSNYINPIVYDRLRSKEVCMKLIQLILLIICSLISVNINEGIIEEQSTVIYLNVIFPIYIVSGILQLYCMLQEKKLSETLVFILTGSGSVCIGAGGGVSGYVGIAKISTELIFHAIISFTIAFMYLLELGYNVHSLASLNF